MNEPSELLRHPGSHGPRTHSDEQEATHPTNIAESQSHLELQSPARGQSLHALGKQSTCLVPQAPSDPPRLWPTRVFVAFWPIVVYDSECGFVQVLPSSGDQ